MKVFKIILASLAINCVIFGLLEAFGYERNYLRKIIRNQKVELPIKSFKPSFLQAPVGQAPKIPYPYVLCPYDKAFTINSFIGISGHSNSFTKFVEGGFLYDFILNLIQEINFGNLEMDKTNPKGDIYVVSSFGDENHPDGAETVIHAHDGDSETFNSLKEKMLAFNSSGTFKPKITTLLEKMIAVVPKEIKAGVSQYDYLNNYVFVISKESCELDDVVEIERLVNELKKINPYTRFTMVTNSNDVDGMEREQCIQHVRALLECKEIQISSCENYYTADFTLPETSRSLALDLANSACGSEYYPDEYNNTYPDDSFDDDEEEFFPEDDHFFPDEEVVDQNGEEEIDVPDKKKKEKKKKEKHTDEHHIHGHHHHHHGHHHHHHGHHHHHHGHHHHHHGHHHHHEGHGHNHHHHGHHHHHHGYDDSHHHHHYNMSCDSFKADGKIIKAFICDFFMTICPYH